MAKAKKKLTEAEIRRLQQDQQDDAYDAYAKAIPIAKKVFATETPSHVAIRGVASVLLSSLAQIVEQHFKNAITETKKIFGDGASDSDIVAVSDELVSSDFEDESLRSILEAVAAARRIFGVDTVDAETAFAVGGLLEDEDGEANLTASVKAVRDATGKVVPDDAFDYWAFVYAVPEDDEDE